MQVTATDVMNSVQQQTQPSHDAPVLRIIKYATNSESTYAME